MGFQKALIFTLISLTSLSFFNSQTLNDEVLGLVVFKSSLIDPNSHLSSWNQDDISPCSWTFVNCSSAGRVTEVVLDGLNLSGKIGRGLEKLRNLKVLSLAQNNLTGDLGAQFSVLKSIEHINLSRNGLSDRIPSSLIGSGSVKVLDLSDNAFSGPVDDEFFMKCGSLMVLSLSGNFLEGQVPSSISECTLLNHLDLSKNKFSGDPRFVSGILGLTQIRKLDLSYNELSGSLPNGVWTLHDLKELSLQENQFSGALPSDLGLCPHLEKLDLSNNLFTETVPVSFQNLSSLNYLNLANNMLTGEFPQWIGGLTKLESLDFSGNRLTGILPSSIGDLTSLSYLSLSGNSLSGGLPKSMVDFHKLTVLQLRGNRFNGSIPDGLFALGLTQVDLSRNELTGSIPKGSSELFDAIESLDLSWNGLSGDVPGEMGLYSKLKYLNLSWNSFGTRMPLEIGSFDSLSVLDLRNGMFNGPIPSDLCASGSLGIVQLDGNSLTGSIPDEIGNCSSLYLLTMSHNNLTGSIPRSISLLKKLKILKLEVNQLTGEIPQELGNLENLLALNISHNKLQGRLPSGGIFQSLQQSSLEGNLGICSPLLKGPCKMNVPKPLVLDPNQMGSRRPGGEMTDSPSISTSRRHRFLSVSAIIAILAAVLIVVGVLVISLLNVSARKRLAFVDNAFESCSSSSRSGASLSMTGKLIWFESKISPSWVVDPDSLLKKADEVGGGVFGTVYKASLGDETSDLAIKSLVTSNMVQNPEDFDREIRVLAKAKHPNLVSLKGYFWTPRSQLLVTDFEPNGNLQTKLHDKPPSSPPLSWRNRFKILLGTAKGLAHLHHSFRPPIVHYNLKPSNILLDENLTPRISDFGLARLLSKLDKHIINNRFQSALGYVAPELACQSLRVNEKCDVYGFGVLILELVTGRKPIEYGEDSVVILNEHVKMMLEEGNVLECVDENMGNEYPEDEVLPVLKLALVCTSQIPSSRPSMAEVVQILQVIKTPIQPQKMEAF